MNRFRVIAAINLVVALTFARAYAEPETAAAEEPATPPADEPQPPPPTSAPAATAVHVAPTAASPLRIEGSGGTSIRLGLLMQPQWQVASSATRDGYANNLYIRRTRVLLGGTLFDKLEFFLETDYANLFLTNDVAPAGAPDNYVKSTPGMNIQDAFVTYKALGNLLKIDAGYMLPSLGHNALQGAGTLYGWDYFAFSFQHGNALGSSGNPAGRDVGVQLRGLFMDGLLECRLGAYQGLRDNRTATEIEASNFFRIAGRLQVNLLDPETGFFYAGSYLGTKRIASVGAAFDIQDSYTYFVLDGFLDMPLGPGLATAQLDLAHWDGGDFIPALVKQTALMAEAGYTLADFGIGPIVRAEQLWGSGALADQLRVSGGVAFWPYGHNSNLKLFYTYAKTEGASRGTNQINLQWQVYFF